ncbi:hypothetical protein CFC21_026004 [Triticum aestivum]|uniref:BTB domain-containing protein n=2 Tax=Triticum aestivum TaxID=4565 RepID=A0A3B6CEY0_WHEAT|nr:hypothetical protein CFC21_026004 [Triticum aestivum]
MSFAGISLIRDGKLWPSGSAANDARAASGYHLLVIESYSCIKGIPKGNHIKSGPFRVGGYLWSLVYHPNGSSLARAGYASASLALAQDVAKPVKAQYGISFIGQFDEQESTHIRSRQVRDFRGKSCGVSYSNFISRDDLEDSEHLKDDSFILRCDIVVIENVVNTKGTGAASPYVTVPPSDMHTHFTHLLTANEGTDVKFKVGDQTITAHRSVLAARSRVFKAELFGPMEGTATTSAIHIQDMEPGIFRAILAFIYSDSEPEMGKGDGEDAMWQWTQLLVAADRYDLQRMKLMCEAKICGFIGVNTTTTILELTEQHRCDGLKKACYDFLGAPGNLRAVAATDGFEDLIMSYPSVLKELIAMLAP